MGGMLSGVLRPGDMLGGRRPGRRLTQGMNTAQYATSTLVRKVRQASRMYARGVMKNATACAAHTPAWPPRTSHAPRPVTPGQPRRRAAPLA